MASELLKAKECIEDLLRKLGSRDDLLFSQGNAIEKAQEVTKRISEILYVSPRETGQKTIGINDIWLAHDKTQIVIMDTKTDAAIAIYSKDINDFVAFVAKLEVMEINNQ